MNDSAPAVALLFDDTELGSQLRVALLERGARIVHEGCVSSLSGELLQRIEADVLVVNLENSADDALDKLYEVIGGDRPRVVFNDAQASRALDGWDRARWARHLAVKALAAGDVDPPRPKDARVIETPMAAANVTALHDIASMPVDVPGNALSEADASEHDDEADSDFIVHADAKQHEYHATESETLAAELEALLASGELPADDEDTDFRGPHYAGDVESLPLYDGNFAEHENASPTESFGSADPGASAHVSALDVTRDASLSPAGIHTDHLQLSELTDVHVPVAAATEHTSARSVSSVSAPTGWALLDDEASPTTEHEKPSPAAFGIEKLSAADFLAPDVDSVASNVEPVMNLELVSLADAVAPKAFVPDHEMILDDLSSALNRLVVLGAAANGTESVCAFLAGLPTGMRSTLLLVQHLGTQATADAARQFAEYCAARCALPVRVAEQGAVARSGEVLLAPSGNEVRIRRDGSVDLTPVDSGEQSPSIDASFTTAASVFGRNALAIVFSGSSTDGVAGAQAIHDRGGQVWVESSSGEHFSDMVSGIFAERLVSFSGTPPELAAHLTEVFS